eukprot:CAMPEP_0114151936 /NCGR_PEP_ID=MMETSP0043_2-20121206/23526_1 /TAXON_ID=464988 /ORGANISM="Hemiselmis andersenii, Strain CCMP644" /LENGTH=57 /DNA_ID=CAMNT_0001246815 /DNA_START=590 /DNA_END=763 /DNA_ORIENTATION=-
MDAHQRAPDAEPDAPLHVVQQPRHAAVGGEEVPGDRRHKRKDPSTPPREAGGDVPVM